MKAMYTSTFPMFVGSALLQIWMNHVAGHIGRQSPDSLINSAACGIGRMATALIEIPDRFVHLQCTVGALINVVMLVQMVVFREATAKFLRENSAEDSGDDTGDADDARGNADTVAWESKGVRMNE
eukprot:jgi/Hompol1/337/HPOL_001130-RA